MWKEYLCSHLLAAQPLPEKTGGQAGHWSSLVERAFWGVRLKLSFPTEEEARVVVFCLKQERCKILEGTCKD